MPFEWTVWQLPLQQPSPAQHVLVAVPHVTGCPTGHWQSLDVHVAPEGQTLPHVPQFRASVWRFTHRADAPVPQTVWPVGQEQVPVVQVAPVAHGLSQPPQCSSSVSGSTQRVGSAAGHSSGALAGQAQLPSTHTSFESGQSMPQAPQFAASVWVFTQRVGAAVGQGVGAVGGQTQEPPTQTSFNSGQIRPHVLQLSASFWRSRQSGESPGQKVAPSHWQTPPAQVPIPHATAQAPQFRGSVA